jgi:predicted nucleic acid-binding protein
VAVVLDAGGLIAVDRRDPHVGALLRVAQQNGIRVMSSAGAVAQAWRSGERQANLARILAGVKVVPLDDRDARRVGELLGEHSSADVVDAHVALIASQSDVVLTSDPGDITGLLATRDVRATVESV